MFLLINNEELHTSNRRIIFNITNDADVNLLMANVNKGDVVELELTEVATNTLHYVLASHKVFVKDVPYSFEFSPYLGVNTLSGTKNLVDFKLNKVMVKLEHDRYKPSLDHYIVTEDDDQNGLVNVDGVPDLIDRVEKNTHRRPRHHHHRHNEDKPAEFHTSPHTAYPNYDVLPQYRHCLAHHRPVHKPEPMKVYKLSKEAHAEILRMLSEFRYILPSGGCVLPIINPDLLVNKDYLEEYVKHELSQLVTIDILSSRIESALKEGSMLKTVSEMVYNLVMQKINNEETPIEAGPTGTEPTDSEATGGTEQTSTPTQPAPTQPAVLPDNVYTKEEANALFLSKLDASINYLSKLDSANLVYKSELEELDVYTKEEIDNLLASITKGSDEPAAEEDSGSDVNDPVDEPTGQGGETEEVPEVTPGEETETEPEPTEGDEPAADPVEPETKEDEETPAPAEDEKTPEQAEESPEPENSEAGDSEINK